MKNLALTATAAMTLSAGTALAGNIDRSGQSSMLLFEPGGYAEFYIRRVDPDVSGIGAGTRVTRGTPTPGQSSGDMAGGYNVAGAGVKTQLRDGLDAALILDQPFGANTIYPSNTRYFARGTTASLESNAITGLLRYRFPSNVSLFGGLRYQTLGADANIPFLGINYSIDASQGEAWGYVLGVGWEKPEIAARVALTYNSAIDYELNAVESTVRGQVPQILKTSTPQSVNLEFETGVAADTLAFGSIRWVDWTQFEVAPQVYTAVVGRPLVYYDNDVFTYNLGVGRRFTENWSGAVSVTYEDPSSGYSLNLGPTNGMTSVNVGGTYTQGPMEISAGLSYIWIGDAETFTVPNVTAANFENNEGVGFGMRVAYRF